MKYEMNTPEWQLHERVKSEISLYHTHMADSHKWEKKAVECRERAELFKAALLKLDPEFSDD